ncbi:MAG: hypothetical protein A3E88_01325 [Legionellales bacterium RIFCSPHIGHO2_12_FULL_35_11]|nr:MAG: hypothetical protein A3E88_01325 [Legionellales bacterium RIFCSPHIGHO2_12_FULL_35_11]
MHNLKLYKYLLLVFCTIFLFGCLKSEKDAEQVKFSRPEKSFKEQKDSAPAGHPIKKFKEQSPKDLPLSRYGNPASYRVDGKTYKVLLNAKDYHERGVASWYGTKFHKRNTSSGEKYDMYALTAAHKTLPLPTYVKVKNLENGKEAIIKVNDRGPFHEGRVLDLSYGAANKLGIFPRGTAKVEITSLSKKENEASYYLQAGAFDSNQSAVQLKSRIEKYTSSDVFISKANHKYLVRVGPFAIKKTSDDLKKILLAKGIKGIFAMII